MKQPVMNQVLWIIAFALIAIASAATAAPPKPALTQDIVYPMASMACNGTGQAVVNHNMVGRVSVSYMLQPTPISASKRFVTSYASFVAGYTVPTASGGSCIHSFVQLQDSLAGANILQSNPFDAVGTVTGQAILHSGGGPYQMAWEPGEAPIATASFLCFGGGGTNFTLTVSVTVRGHFESF